MDISTVIANIASGSATATPNTGSDALDMVTHLPSQLINWAAGLVAQLGS